MPNKARFYVLLIAVCASAACTKDKQTTTTQTVTYKPSTAYIVNNNAWPVNFRLYKTAEDYRNSTNALVSMRLDSGAFYTYVIDSPVIRYMEWFTDDGAYTNWAAETYTGLDADHPINNLDFVLQVNGNGRNIYNDTIYLDEGKYILSKQAAISNREKFADNGLKDFLLPGNVPSSNWHAVGAKDIYDVIDVWNGLTSNERAFGLTIYKDQTITTSFRDSLGNEGKDHFSYVRVSGKPHAELLAFNVAWHIELTSTKLRPVPGDTVVFFHYPYNYRLVKD